MRSISLAAALNLLVVSKSKASEVVSISTEQVISQVTAEALERVNLIIGSFSSIVTVLLIVIGFFVYGSLRELKTETKENVTTSISERLSNSAFVDGIIKSSVEQVVRRELDIRNSVILSRYEELNLRFEITKLNDLANIIDGKDSFTNAERDEAVEILRSLSGRHETHSKTQFVTALNKIVVAFFRADLRHEVSEIERLYQSVLLSSPQCVFCLVQHYSMVVFGSVEPDEEDIHRLRLYIEACEKIQRSDIVLMYSILLSARFSENWVENVRMHLDDANALDEASRHFLFETMARNCDPKNLAITPYPRHERIAALHKKVVDRFVDDFSVWIEASEPFETKVEQELDFGNSGE